MKRILSIAVAFAATITAMAQNIAVVNPSNSTSIYQTLDEAITNAEDGSIIYIPGGGYAVTDNAKIDKKLTIMGVSHRGDTDNVDGATVISGNLNFIKGSSHSAVIGVYTSGEVIITDSVAQFTMRYCNVKSVQVKSSKSSGMVIDQCYLRSTCNFGNCNVQLTNNIIHTAQNINGGKIDHCIITARYCYSGYDYYTTLNSVNNTQITYNFFTSNGGGVYSYARHRGDNCFVSNNCAGTDSWGDDCKQLPKDTKWEAVFKAPKGVTIASDYHLTETWAQSKDPDLTGIGIYGGTGFSDEAVAPIPRIVSKKVAERTDGSGKLQIEVTVKAQ